MEDSAKKELTIDSQEKFLNEMGVSISKLIKASLDSESEFQITPAKLSIIKLNLSGYPLLGLEAECEVVIKSKDINSGELIEGRETIRARIMPNADPRMVLIFDQDRYSVSRSPTEYLGEIRPRFGDNGGNAIVTNGLLEGRDSLAL